MTNRIVSGLTLGVLVLVALVTLLALAPQEVGAKKEEIDRPATVGETILAGGVSLGQGDFSGQGQPASTFLQPAALASEIWQLGFTVEGQLTYNDVTGRILDKAAFRSRRSSDIYFVFPAPANRPTISSAQFRIISQTGTYAGDATLSLEILKQKTGQLRAVVSTASPGWPEAGGSWTPLALSNTDLQIAPDEFLAFHFHLSGSPGGDLAARPEFTVAVQRATPTLSGQALAASQTSPVSMAVWRSGFTIEGTHVYDDVEERFVRSGFSPAETPTYEAMAGKLAGTVAAFRSNRAVSDIYYLFPPPTSLTTLQSTQYQVISRAGSYEAGKVYLTFRIYNQAGQLQHILNKNIDLTSAVDGQWTGVALTNETIEPDEFLAARVEFEGGSTDDLDLRMLFEVEVVSAIWEPDPLFDQDTYLPLVFE